MVAIGRYVIVKKAPQQTRRTETGFDLSVEKNDRFIQGTVVSASELAKEAGIKDGDIVLYDKFASNDFLAPNGDLMKTVTITDIAVVF